jgi:predicted MFS family arabinose efflux permease
MNKSRFRWYSLGFLPLFVLAHFSHHLLTAIAVPLLPFIRDEFNLDYTRAGLIISAFSISYGISQLPAGWLADHIGRRILITVSMLGVAVTGFLISFSQTYFLLILLLIIMGIAGGGYHPSAPPLILAAVPPGKRGRSMGFHMVGGSASHFLAPVIAGAIAAAWGWRGSYLGLAIPTIIFGVVFYILLGRHKTTVEPKLEVTENRGGIEQPPGDTRRLVSFIILSTLVQAVVITIISFIPLFLVDHFAVTEEKAAVLLAFVYSAGLWASPLGGYLADRLGRIQVVLAVCFVTGPMVYLLTVTPYGFGIMALLLLIGTTIYVRAPATEAYIVSHTSRKRRSTVLGIYYFGHMEGVGLLTPLFGYLIDRFGLQFGFNIAAVVILLVTVAFALPLLAGSEKGHT